MFLLSIGDRHVGHGTHPQLSTGCWGLADVEPPDLVSMSEMGSHSGGGLCRGYPDFSMLFSVTHIYAARYDRFVGEEFSEEGLLECNYRDGDSGNSTFFIESPHGGVFP